jgi:cytochrome bd ubiquinol oxidase subunit I
VTPETLDLARLQFALTAGTHFLFVALTLGLATFVACAQTMATVTRDPARARMTRFWGQLYVINYAVGIVTGLVMEFQFGLNWNGLSHYAGNVFGASLAMETLVAFFIESTFLGLWIFGWDRLNRWVHLGLIWVVTLTAYASAYWIMVSNGFLQNPVGYAANGRPGDGAHGVLRLTDAWAVLTNPSAVTAFFHILAGAILVAGFFVAGVSAYHLFRRTEESDAFVRWLRIGVFASAPAVVLSAVSGGVQFGTVEAVQPMKTAALSHRAAEVAWLQSEMVARYGPGDYTPPGWMDTGAIVMLTAFALMFFLTAVGVLLALSRTVVRRFLPWHLVLMAAVPLPYAAMIAGWVFREGGRQPWVVYGLLKTEDAVSPLSPGAMWASLITFSVLFGVLLVVNYGLLARHAVRGPRATTLGRPEGDTDPGPLPAASY